MASRKAQKTAAQSLPERSPSAGEAGAVSSRSAAQQLALVEGALESVMQCDLLSAAQLGRLAACSKHMDSIVRDAPCWETLFNEAVQSAHDKYSQVPSSFRALLLCHPRSAVA